jgi:peptide/nickel transport system substrate-binding protein
MAQLNFRLRFRRGIRKQRKQVEQLSQTAEAQLERNFFRRLSKFGSVGRFVTGWVLLCILLIGCLVAQIQALGAYYQSTQPVAGGIFREGIVGTFTNANPVYATSDVNVAVSRLIFDGLFKYNDQNQLVGDLASSWSVDAADTTYTVHLKPHLSWQDGQPLTASDVAFTYHTIQDPDALSPLASSWAGIKVVAVNPTTLTFQLPNPLSSFIDSMTNGIIPEHLLGSVPVGEMRSVSFNTTDPVGSGPFTWDTLTVSGNDPSVAEEQIQLIPFKNYNAGAPKLGQFVVNAYASVDKMEQDYAHQDLTAMTGYDRLPASDTQISTNHLYNMTLTAANYVFFRTTSPILSDATVRQALVQGAPTAAALATLPYVARPVQEPLLNGQLGYNAVYRQVSNQPTTADTTLTNAGWILGSNGVRTKDGKPLAFTLTVQDDVNDVAVANTLVSGWKKIGIAVTLAKLSVDDFQTVVTAHQYDAVLSSVPIGVDPDVYIYWDSSQADIRSTSRPNLSEYNSPIADSALEAGRTRLDPSLRVIKYRPFLQAWQQDNPALGLYQPQLQYVSHDPIYGLNDHTINVDADRYDNVNNWMIRTAQVTNP